MERKKQKEQDLNKKTINNVSYIFIGLFALLVVHIVIFVVFDSANIVINSYNPRLEQIEENIVRGKIMDRDGNVLAETVIDGTTEYRVYPYENVFAHIVGYSERGKTGLEALVNYDLLKSNVSIIDKTIQAVSNQKSRGNNVVATLDAELQKLAHQLLGNRKGAIVAIEPSTGKIICMVSKPDFNPNDIESIWDKLVEEEKKSPLKSPLVNRATNGLYPPGSTFKIITSLAYMRENPSWEDYTYDCKGKDVFGEYTLHCHFNKAHDKETLEDAVKYSCNTAFADMAMGMDISKYRHVAEDLLFNNPLPYSLPYKESSFVLNTDSSVEDIAETSIGQGKTIITPFHNALITAAVANGGILMKPYLVDRIENEKGKTVSKYLPEFYKKILEVDEAKTLTGFMKKVVSEGTGKTSAVEGIKVAGKTGSAENTTGVSHAWYVGFAPADNPQLAVSIIVESSGTSTKYAAPIAKALFEAYIKE
ncbi:penicillin-binding protein 2 [Vallitalea pronyensis]|uniref:Penicillin-binding protein 2 n=1 Tax=Vallitalea pronyensis TaxID=1348613 RepID=A0A8J8MLK6_9FIRM|nr:penicillin-binding transpeptidase domain-containing protein [Vallitalea pronyensis]QUI23498.1 penicillin-binding protein 2 [Vallitalea pronyensis]